MPEVIVINADRAEITRLDRAAKAGDPEAIDYMSNWWADYSDVELACFICDAVVEKPIHSAIVGSVSNSSKVDILPLCSKCKNLPRQLQWARIYQNSAKDASRGHGQASALFVLSPS